MNEGFYEGLSPLSASQRILEQHHGDASSESIEFIMRLILPLPPESSDDVAYYGLQHILPLL
jgi:hypothetical protein